MPFRKWFFLPWLLWLALWGCGRAGSPGPSPTLGAVPPPEVRPYLEQARAAAATLREVAPKSVQFQQAEAATWPDDCLGAYDLDTPTCAPGPVAGYRLLLSTPRGPVWIHLAPERGLVRPYLAVLFRRSGTLLGLCLELAILPDGTYRLRDFCRQTVLRRGTLPSEAWQPVETALRTYAPFRHLRQVPPGAYDAAEDQLACNGWGMQEAPPEARDTLADHLADWVMRLQAGDEP